MYGLPDMETYWKVNNPMSSVHEITVPCMCVSSEADPVIEKRMIPYDAFKIHPKSMLVTTSFGGHCGFLARGLVPWADTLCLEYLLTALEFINK